MHNPCKMLVANVKVRVGKHVMAVAILHVQAGVILFVQIIV